MAQTRSIGANLLATPTVLRGSAVVAAGAGVTPPATFDTTKLQNTLRVPIEITEILVTVHEFGSLDRAGTTNEDAGAAIEMDLRVGGKHLTNGFVPFQTLAPWNSGEDSAWSAGGALTAAATFNQRRIVLPEPIRLRPNVGFSGAARRAPVETVTSASAVTTTVTLTAIGRVVPEGILSPTAQALPLWTAATLLATATVLVPKTSERDLFNPLQVPLDVARIVVASSKAGAAGQSASGPLGLGAIEYDPILRMRWPNGDLLGVDPIYLQSAFIREHTIAHKFQLPGGSRVTAAFDFTNPGAGATTPYLQIAIFGTRREVL